MKQNKFKIWIEAARPKTLAAAFVPVMVGASIAARENEFDLIPSLVALTCAILIQVGTNFANDYFDFVKGADRDDRIGFRRATASGYISAKQMKQATIYTMGLSFLLGLYLVWHAGWIILVLGVLSLLFGILYTGGPFPLGYNGLGDLFVFIFFGLVAVMGTYYVNALRWSIDSFWASLAIGALSTNILVVNNLRDVESDAQSGKNTLGVLLGENALRWEYLCMLLIALAIPLYLFMQSDFEPAILITYLAFPFGIILTVRIWIEEEKIKLNKRLEQSAAFMTIFGILFSLGILWS